MLNKSAKPFMVNDPLLLQAIIGNSFCKHAPLKESAGYLFIDRDHIGRAFLEYCYSKIFNLHRFPGYENFYTKSASTCRKLIKAGEMTDDDINASIKQLKDLYGYTQEHLKQQGISELILYRWLRVPEKSTIKQKGNHIKFYSNTIMSFSYSPEHNYGTSLQIVKRVPIEKVLMLDYLTAYDSCVCDKRVFKGEDEAWVLNDDKYGNIDAEIYRKTDDTEFEQIDDSSVILSNINRVSNATDCSIKDTIMNPPKPCEIGYLTKKLISRNASRIIKKYE